MNASNQILVFDRALVTRRRERVAKKFVAHSALLEESATYLMDRFDDVKKIFEAILCLGRTNDPLIELLGKKTSASISVSDFTNEPEILPFETNSYDLIISNFNLHWVNDLPGALIQIRNALRPGGLFLAAMPGGLTLHELSKSILDAELAVTGGISPRLSPTIELPTASSLMQRAGFDLPVTDQEVITLLYPDAFALMHDLRGMGETNAHTQRLRRFTRRSVFTETARIYKEKHGDADGHIPATFEIIFLHGWKS